jgi:type 1 glutamine amidotransferase
MKYIMAGLMTCALLMGVAQAQDSTNAPKKVLVVTATYEFTHSSIPLSEKVIADLGKTSGAYTVVDYIRSGPRPTDADKEVEKQKVEKWQANVKADFAAKMSADGLKKYDAVIFSSTTGNLPIPSMDDFLTWIKNGGNFIGMHAASDTFHASPAFIEMIGGEFKIHGPQVKVECINEDHNHPATKHFGDIYEVYDEIYQFKNFHREKVHGLLTLDKHPNEKTPGDYPVSWCKMVGKGRVFYTSLGHREDVWENPDYQKHVLGGIKWALGLEPGDATPQKK